MKKISYIFILVILLSSCKFDSDTSENISVISTRSINSSTSLAEVWDLEMYSTQAEKSNNFTNNGEVVLYKGVIYFCSDENDRQGIYSYDKGKIRLLKSGFFTHLEIANDVIYFLYEADRFFGSMSIDGNNFVIHEKEKEIRHYVAQGDKLYYLSYDIINNNTKNIIKSFQNQAYDKSTIVKEFDKDLSISNLFLINSNFYFTAIKKQDIDINKYMIIKMDINTFNCIEIAKASFSVIYFDDNYIYFLDEKTNGISRCDKNGEKIEKLTYNDKSFHSTKFIKDGHLIYLEDDYIIACDLKTLEKKTFKSSLDNIYILGNYAYEQRESKLIRELIKVEEK